MATANFFELLGDDEGGDPQEVVARAVKEEAKKPAPQAPKEKEQAAPAPAAPAAAAASAPARGGRGGYRGRGGADRGGRGGYQSQNYRPVGSADDAGDADNASGNAERGRGRGGGGGYRGRGRGGGANYHGNNNVAGSHFGNNIAAGAEEGAVAERTDERPPRRREFDRHSGTGRGHETKRSGSGKGNWGSTSDAITAEITAEKADDKDVEATDAPAAEPAEGEAPAAAEEAKPAEEDNEMSLEEYEKLLEERRKNLNKPVEVRKVNKDKAFETMQVVTRPSEDEEIFVQLSADKKGKKKLEEAKREQRESNKAKPMSITTFFNPDGTVDAEELAAKYYGNRNRGRGGPRGGRGRGGYEGGRGGYEGGRGGSEGGRGGFEGGRGGYEGGRGRGGYQGGYQGNNQGYRGRSASASAPRIDDDASFPTLGGKPVAA